MNIYFNPLVQRICQAASQALRNTDDGLAIVTIKVLMNGRNQPVLWTVSGCDRLEPANKAAAFLEGMTSSAIDVT